MALIGNSYMNVIPKFPNLDSQVKKALGGIDTTSAGIKMGEGVGRGMSGGLAKSGAVIGAFSAITQKAMSAIAGSVGAAASRFDTLNQYPLVMESLGYGAESAQSSIEKMSDRLQSLPTRLDSMASTVQGISAITKDLDLATDAGLALNDMLVASGSSTQLTTAAMEQFRQMLAKGKPEMEDWKSLTSAMPGQMAQLAQAMLGPTATANDLYAALGGGKNEAIFSMDDLLQAMIRLDVEGGEGITSFKEQAETAAGGIQTSISNMQNAIVKGIAGVFDAIGKENIAGAADGVKDVINDVSAVAKDAVAAVMPTVVSMGEKIGEIGPQAAVAAAGFAAFKTVGGHVSDAASRLGALNDETKKAGKSAGALQKANALLGTSFSPVSLGLTAASVAGGLLVASFVDAKRRSDDLEAATKGLSDAVSDASGLDEYMGKIEGIGEAAGFTAMSVDDLASANAERARSIQQSVDEAEAEISQLNAVQSVISQYAGQTDLSADAQGRLEWAISQVNEQFGLSITAADAAAGSYTDMEGNVVDLKSSIDSLVESKKEEIRTTALTDSLTEAYKAQADAADTLAEARQRAEYAQRQYDESAAAGVTNLEGLGIALEKANSDLGAATEQYNSATEAVGMLEGELGDAAVSASESADAFDAWGSTVSPLFESILKRGGTTLAGLKDDLRDLGASTEDLASLSDDELNGLASTYDGTASSIVSALDRLGVSYDEGAAASARAASEIRSAIAEMEGSVAQSLDSAGVDLADFSSKLSAAGVSTDDLRRIGSDNLAALASACGGNVDAMVYYIQHYNDTPLLDKDGNIQVDQASLIDAQGNVYTWNGTSLYDKSGNAYVGDASLMDAQGNLYTWNGSVLEPKSSSAWVGGNIDAANSSIDEFRRTPNDLGEKTGSVNIFQNIFRTVTDFFTGNASGGVRKHADGFIATGPTMIGPRDMIGEAGAEAYFSLGGSDYIVPLTNKRYSQPFIDMVAEGVAARTGANERISNTYNVYSNDPNLVAAVVAQKQLSAYRDGLR